jgi:hypothetical protein
MLGFDESEGVKYQEGWRVAFRLDNVKSTMDLLH